MNRGRDEAAMVEVVDRIERNPSLLGLRPNGGVHGAIVCGRDRDPRAGEITSAIGTAPDLDGPLCRQVLEPGGGLTAHDRDMRARVEQPQHLLLGDRPAPDDHGPTPPEVEKHGVESRRAADRCGGHGVTGTEARSASTPTRWQKSPNRSAPSRSSRYRSNSGRTAVTS